jgi:hypothetical protein
MKKNHHQESSSDVIKNHLGPGHLWLTPVILVLRQRSRGSRFGASPGK